jgi:hypothetical protein
MLGQQCGGVGDCCAGYTCNQLGSNLACDGKTTCTCASASL